MNAKRHLPVRWLIVASLLLGPLARAGEVRTPAVAGIFYPADSTALGSKVDALIAAAADQQLDAVRAIIVPHAGYEFSGAIAASAYRQLKGRAFQTVVVMGPAHFASFDGASVSDASVYRTPLGDVMVSDLARKLGGIRPFRINASTVVERPEWARAANLMRGTKENAETWEHSIEVELPFLQRTLPSFSLVPIVMGNVDPRRTADALAQVIDASTLIVASSDLSHYHSSTEAQELDRRLINAVLRLDVNAAAEGEACGRTAILTLMHLAKRLGWQPHLLDLRNSGDVSGDRSRAVGYAAVVFTDGTTSATANIGPLSTYERSVILKLARDAVENAVHAEHFNPDASTLPAALSKPRACFVTLLEHGELRGCIGTLTADGPLYRMVLEAARSAALHDTRFPPVKARELKQLHLEVSVLTEPQPLAFSTPQELLQKIRPKIDGVVLKIGAREATYLPQVWTDLPDKVRFLNSLAEKAGLAPDAWRGKNVSVQTYQVETFAEPE